MEDTFGGREEKVGDPTPRGGGRKAKTRDQEEMVGVRGRKCWKKKDSEKHWMIGQKERKGWVESNEMKLESPLIFPFINLKGVETNTRKAFEQQI